MSQKLTFLLLIGTFFSFAQDSIYHVSFDLRASKNDQLQITLNVPQVQEDSIEFHLPKIVPGTYSISDFGRFISNFKALDASGNELPVRKKDINRWMIQNAKQLSTITYLVDDTFDKNPNYQQNVIFEPGGTSIEADKGVFVLNTFGIIGYLDGYQFLPFEIDISHHSKHYGASSLQREVLSEETDRFTASNYNFLADGPIMYCKPDTAIKKIDGAEIIISLYSPNGKLTAAEVMNNLNDLIEAQTAYLGGRLPVDRYAYLIYLLDYNPLSGGMGALEHSYSSLYTLPEASAKRISQIVRDVAAHEFLHILTPLNIHSEQIHQFNYIDPDMSKHLWMYEGVTEYSAMHVQVRSGLFDEATFLDNIKEKILIAGRFPEVSFTEMSEKILEPEFEPMYSNVYYKGALIGLSLDLLLIHHSDGTLDLPSLMAKLAEKYGPHQAFEDDRLIDEITNMTYPAIGQFFESHVIGNQPLPLAEVLSLAGYDFKSSETVQTPTLGNISFSANENYQIIVENTANMNEFGKQLGYQPGDILQSINGKEITLETIQDVLEGFQMNTQSGDKIKIDVLREMNGKQKKVKLKAIAELVEVDRPSEIISQTELSDLQKQTRNIWLNGLQ